MKRFFLVLCLCFLAHGAQAAPKVIEVVSPLGIKAWLISSQRLPLLSVSFAFRGGVEKDDPQKQGMATMATALLTQGAGPYDDEAYQKKLADLSVGLSLSAGRDAIYGEVKTLTRHAPAAFHLLSLALTSPRLEPQTIERLRQQQLAAIHMQMADPDWQARYAVFSRLFGDHPYGMRSLGTIESLRRLSREDLSAFLARRLTKENLVVSVVGAIDPKTLGPLLDQAFGALPERAEDVPVPPMPKAFDSTSILLKREGTQTNIFFAMPMMTVSDKDWPAAQIANYILGGGGFSSRFMKTVREENGLTYGISTGLSSTEKTGLLVGQIAANNDKAGQAAVLARNVWRDFFENGPNLSEVEAAKAYLTGSLPLEMTSIDAAASLLLSLQMDGFSSDYLTVRSQRINNVTRTEVLRVIKRWFDPARATFAFVGQPSGLIADETQPLVTE